MMTQKKTIVLLSGGLDSTVAFYEALQQNEVMAALSFHYGSKHNNREIPCAVYHARENDVPYVVIRLDCIEEHFTSDLLCSGGDVPEGHYEEENMRRTVVPFRNGIMLSLAAGFAESRGADALVIAAHAGDHAVYPDCRESFMTAMAEAVRLGTYAAIEIIRPFINRTKSQIVSRGRELGVDFSQTWSCYKGRDMHCGKCGTCVERREAFLLAGVPDPTVYESQDPLPPRPVMETRT